MKIYLFIPLMLFIALQQIGKADVNVLVIGSATDSSTVSPGATSVSAFDPAQVVAELRSILRGASLGEVNVTLEDFHGASETYKHTTLFSWFQFPFPEGIEETKRWPNLRGERDVDWDYVVLIGDAHTMEHLPGFYALGVSEIGKEVAKGSAKTVLLMPWPAANSTSTVDHYKEVVYRVGRSGGYAVAPAGIAWKNSSEAREAGGAKQAKHPTEQGAYLAAATLFSRFFNKSASSSTYKYDRKLADLAHETVQKNKGAIQYTGRFSSPHPHRAQFNPSRKVRYSFTGTSTERSHMERLRTVMDQCRVEHSDHLSHRYDSNDPKADKGGWSEDVAIPIEFNIGKFGFYKYDEFNVNPAYWKRAYTFQYQGHLSSNEQAIGRISTHDMNAGVKAYQQAPHVGATIPRSSWALLHRLSPELSMNGHGNHLSQIAILPNASFIYTCDSGRCPLTPRADRPTDEWNAMRVGYEAGWIMGALQARAPGFRVLPSAARKHEINNYFPTGPEEMTVQFIFKPEASVTVHLSCTNSSLIKISPSTLTFTPENHDVAQRYTVSIADGAPFAEEDITVKVTTTSKDEVYHQLSDSWLYTAKSAGANSLPVATKDRYRVGVNKPLVAAKDEGLLANDIASLESPAGQAAVKKGPTNGRLRLSGDGSFRYRPNRNFEGSDSFTYNVANANGRSEEATVTIAVSDLDPSLILWYDFEKENGATVNDSTAYGRDGTMVKPVRQVAGVADGKFGVDLTGGAIEIPIDQEFYDLVDRELSISFWSHLDSVKKGKGTSVLLKGTKTYDDIEYKSCEIKFQSNAADGQSSIFWESGIYTQNNRVGSYSIMNARKHSKGKIPLTLEVINDQWVHWTFVRSENGFFRVYKDRVLAFQGSLAGLNAFGLIDEVDNLVLGPSFKGKVDDFRIYNRELSVSDITQVMIKSCPSLAGTLKNAKSNRKK